MRNTSEKNVDSHNNETERKIAKINCNSDCTKGILIYVVVILHSTKDTNSGALSLSLSLTRTHIYISSQTRIKSIEFGLKSNQIKTL